MIGTVGRVRISRGTTAGGRRPDLTLGTLPWLTTRSGAGESLGVELYKAASGRTRWFRESASTCPRLLCALRGAAVSAPPEGTRPQAAPGCIGSRIRIDAAATCPFRRVQRSGPPDLA